jgi:hypothetical protein
VRIPRVREARSRYEPRAMSEARTSAVRVRRRVCEPVVVPGISGISIVTWPTAQRGGRDGARAGAGEAWEVTRGEGWASRSTTASAFHAGGAFAPASSGGVGIVGAVGAGGDGVADGVADDVVVAVLVGGEDDQLGFDVRGG